MLQKDTSRTNAEPGQNRPRHDLDALVRVSVLHSAIVLNRLPTMEDALGHLREEGCRHKDILDSTPLQPSDERIQLDPGIPEQVRKSNLPYFHSGDDNRGLIESNVAHE